MKKLVLLTLAIFLLPLGILLSGCGESVTTHKIELSSSDISLGNVSGIGSYKKGQEVTIKAIEKSPTTNPFVGWIKNNVLVSKNNPYAFVASSETEGKYIAVFQEENLPYNNLTFIKSTAHAEGITNIELSFKVGLELNFQDEIFKGKFDYVDNTISHDIISTAVLNLNEAYYYSVDVTIIQKATPRTFKLSGYFSKKQIENATQITDSLVLTQKSQGQDLFSLTLTFSTLTK